MMKIFAFPKTGIPYNQSFYAAVEAAGGSVEEGVFSGRWLLKNLNAGDAVHLHWPSFSYTGSRSRIGLYKDFLRFVLILALVRVKGARLFWTAHNLMPHDRGIVPSVDVLARRIVILVSRRVFVHGEHAARILVERFSSARKKVVVIQHGNWIGHYACDVSRAAARARLSIDGASFVYLFIGLCKEYKNLEGLIAAYHQIPGDSMLLVAGKFQSQEYRTRIEGMARVDPRIRIDPKYIPDHEMQNYLIAADVVVAPYRDILTSGTAMLALSFGRPVVSVRLGYLIDLITPSTGLLYDPDQPQDLVDALNEVRRRRYDSETILAWARSFDWEQSARRFLAEVA